MHANDLARHWTLAPDTIHLNHGSFGACPSEVLKAQTRVRDQLERQPSLFFAVEAPRRLRMAREALGRFVGCDPNDLVFVPNVTTAINSVMGSLKLGADDEIAFTNHEYNATRNIILHAGRQLGCPVRILDVPFPVGSSEEVAEAILSGVSDRTRLIVLDHVTSQTGMIIPLEILIPIFRDRGIDVFVDGAHAPGMLALEVARLAPAYYTGNCHKWLCAPKGAGFLYVRPDLQGSIRPANISHGANSGTTGSERFRMEFDWTGTEDPSAQIVVRDAIEFMGGLLPEGWSEVMQRNHALCKLGREIVCDALGTTPACPDEMIGSLASIPLPDSSQYAPPDAHSSLDPDPLHEDLLHRHGIEVPVLSCPAYPKRMIRISAQLYNHPSDYERLAAALVSLL